MNNPSPTGFEKDGQKLWSDYIKPFVDEVHSDLYGTAYGIINPGNDFRVVIEAHADEISWFVNYITDDGFIYVIRNGGSDHIIAPSMRVNIHTKGGIVKGFSVGLLFIPERVRILIWLHLWKISVLMLVLKQRQKSLKWVSM